MVVVGKIEIPGVVDAPGAGVWAIIDGLAVFVHLGRRLVRLSQRAPAVLHDPRPVRRGCAVLHDLSVQNSGEVLLGIIIVVSDDRDLVVSVFHAVVVLGPGSRVHIALVADRIAGHALVRPVTDGDAVTPGKLRLDGGGARRVVPRPEPQVVRFTGRGQVVAVLKAQNDVGVEILGGQWDGPVVIGRVFRFAEGFVIEAHFGIEAPILIIHVLGDKASLLKGLKHHLILEVVLIVLPARRGGFFRFIGVVQSPAVFAAIGVGLPAVDLLQLRLRAKAGCEEAGAVGRAAADVVDGVDVGLLRLAGVIALADL